MYIFERKGQENDIFQSSNTQKALLTCLIPPSGNSKSVVLGHKKNKCKHGSMTHCQNVHGFDCLFYFIFSLNLSEVFDFLDLKEPQSAVCHNQ